MDNAEERLDAEMLRKKAEQILKERSKEGSSEISDADGLKLIHELEVHQVELELQNEELLASKSAMQKIARNYLDLFDLAPVGYMTLSEEGKIIEVNLFISEMFGRDRHSLQGSRFGFFVSEDSKPVYHDFLEKAFSGKTLESCELTLQGGSIIPAKVHLSCIVSLDRSHCKVIVVDMTEIDQKEQALKESEEKYRLLAESSPQMIYLIDKKGRIIYLNSVAASAFRADAPDLIGKRLSEVYPPDVAERHFSTIRKVFESGEKIHVEIEEDFPAGKIWIDVALAPLINGAGEVIAVLGLSNNITGRKYAEEEIKHKNEALQKANAEKDKFFSILAHDLRSPFNSFLGLTKVMAEELSSLTQEQVRKASESLLKSATHLYGLIENLLEWSRMQRGLIPFEPESLQLLPLIDECLRESIEIAGKKGLAIRYEIPENSELFADRLMMKSVLRNLVTNAVKFTRKGGEIVISAARTDGKATVIAIKDNGIGMNEKMVEGLFKMDIATQRKGTDGEPSTGLGLNICRDFVERHGGMLRAESEEADPSSGKSGGSTFFITLPAKPG